MVKVFGGYLSYRGLVGNVSVTAVPVAVTNRVAANGV